MSITGDIGAGIAIGSSLMSAHSSKKAAKANKKALKAEAKYQRYRGNVDAEKHMEAVNKLIAKGNVAFAKNGVRLSSNSVNDVFAENMQEGLYDAAMIRSDAEARAKAAKAGIQSYNIQAKNAQFGAYAEVGQTLLTMNE